MKTEIDLKSGTAFFPSISFGECAEPTTTRIHGKVKLSDEAKHRMAKAVESLTEYMRTYSDQPGYKEYADITLINDVIYGLGIALEPKEHQGPTGFDKFKQKIVRHLSFKPRATKKHYTSAQLLALQKKIQRLLDHRNDVMRANGIIGKTTATHLNRAGIYSKQDLQTFTDNENIHVTGVGQKSLKKINAWLHHKSKR